MTFHTTLILVKSRGDGTIGITLFTTIDESNSRLNHQNVELIDNNPGMISSPATILRLWDDLGSAKDENQEGNDGSYVACYMKEHQGIEVESVRKHVIAMISNAWKCLNYECLSRNPFSSSFARLL
ncbi:hypothetical protein CCACVL1_05752 [Corchorus capsularis]|uniref:Terpene synthase metal-binding domain-containing protein n=1 Tax=Corchorus capsularis TaxID=210143 RepID=A0A1R3JJ58_COCAP|nr:hypothetical protein CCACVL1_05752 [Corchorus capsularis]